MTATEINYQASPEQQQYAIVDVDAIAYLYFIPEALGTRLGHAFVRAYEAGRDWQGGSADQGHRDPHLGGKGLLELFRPLLIDGSTTRLVPDNVIAQDGAPYSDSGGVFPSGHTNTGFIDRVLLAEMLPKRLTCSAPF